MSINDVLLLEDARLNAIANLKYSLGDPGHQRPNFDGFIYIHYAVPPYSARIKAICILPIGKIWLGSVCWPPYATPGNEAEHRINGGWVKTPTLF